MLTGSDSLLCYVQFGFYRPAEKLPPLPLPWLVAKSWPVWFIQSKLLIKKTTSYALENTCKNWHLYSTNRSTAPYQWTSVLNSHSPSSLAPCPYFLRAGFSKCGPQSSSISITWELFRNAGAWAQPRPTESEALWVGHGSLCFNRPSGC